MSKKFEVVLNVSVTSKASVTMIPTLPKALWFEFMMPSKVAKDFLANQDELFEIDCRKYGLRPALWNHRVQCFKMVHYHWFNVLMDAAQKMRKIIY